MANDLQQGSAPATAAAEQAKRSSGENARVRKLHSMANRGFFALASFIAISIGAIDDFSILPSFPESFRATLGTPPSANMVSAALLLYSFAAIVLILARMTMRIPKFGVFANVGYLSGFYFFYHFSGTMQENFWAVLAAGSTILVLETYHLRTWCAEEIRKELEGGPHDDPPPFDAP